MIPVRGIIYTTRYTYDARDRVLSIIYPDGRTVTYTRDALGRIQSVTATVNAVNQAIVSGRTYRADGLLLSQIYGNGLSEARSYNLKGELTYQSLGSADTRLYGYDPNGNLASLQSLPQVADYGYDALDRLISDQITSTPASTRSFTYDGNGNRTSDNGGSYTYAANSNRLTQTPLATVTLDAVGNTLSDGTYTYSYNQDGHLAHVESGTNVLASYTYNHLRQRTRKVTSQGTTVYHYDIEGHLIVETRADGTLIKAYLWAEDQPIGQISAGIPEALVYLHADHLGSPRLATDAGGTKVWSWEGDAFGGAPPDPDPDGDTLETVVNLRFAGQYFDQGTGLYYNWNRYYDPRTGRYLSSDPIGLDGGLNTYLYANANPLRFVDPQGLETGTVTLPRVRPIPGLPSWAKNPIGLCVFLLTYSSSVGEGSDVVPRSCGGGEPGGASCPTDDEDDDECEQLLATDTATCNGITRARGAVAGAKCHASASQRYAACLRGEPLPPLDTWNN